VRRRPKAPSFASGGGCAVCGGSLSAAPRLAARWVVRPEGCGGGCAVCGGSLSAAAVVGVLCAAPAKGPELRERWWVCCVRRGRELSHRPSPKDLSHPPKRLHPRKAAQSAAHKRGCWGRGAKARRGSLGRSRL
jgi:hypothetical protein